MLFDLTGDGVPERIAWTEEGRDDSWLAMDRNGNGKIDNGTELFGNHSLAYANDNRVKTANGFEMLNFLQGPSYGVSRIGDGVVDANDAPFARLLLWRDANHNGSSEPEELTSAVSAGIASIDTAYKEKRKQDNHGNEFRQKGSSQWSDGETGVIYDVWLRGVQ